MAATTILYNNPADAMDKITFRVSVSSNYQPMLHPSYEKDGTTPPINEDEDCISMFSVSDIVRAADGGVPLKILNLEDVPRILAIMTAFTLYIKDVTANIVLEDEHQIFINSVESTILKFKAVADVLPKAAIDEPVRDIHDLLLQGGEDAQT